MKNAVETSPLHKVRTLRCDADHAFDVYVDRIGEWWPTETHSVYGAEARGVEIEPGVGGRIIETGPTGEQSVWGTLTAWTPKRQLAHSWHPGDAPAAATQVEVSFTPVDGGGCEVRLVHSGWDALGVTSQRQGYDMGWDMVLGRYFELADGR